MPKSRTRKPKSRSTNPADRRQRRVDGLIDSLAEDYATWAANTAEADATDDEARADFMAFARGQLETVKSLYVFLGAGERPVANLRIDPRAVPDALDVLLDTDDVDDLRYYIGTLVDWVTFLEETGRWEGTAEDLEAVTEVLDAEAEAVGGIVDVDSEDEGVPRREPTEEEALAFATSSPLVRCARALLDWVGEGRAVASDGALPPAEAEEAAALVGKGAADPGRRLSRLWASLRHAELIEIEEADAADDSGSTARLGEDAARLGTGDGLGRLEAQFLATEFVIATCSRALYTPEGDAVEAALATLLTRAVLEEPLPLSVVEDLATDAPEDADPAELQTVSIVLMDELRELAALGLVDLSAGLVDVPAAALDAVYDAFESPEDEDDDEDWEDDTAD
ncbi:hypothetical protein [Sinomonas susongensis]|uniref:hypothetical protein n=1 Tax=Sinomonas susongensis TaxID=1324851 RepID=UPI001107D53F|nr:hypothetical protein [Sinomonas susongensis]